VFIVVLSGSEMNEEIEATLQAGANAFLRKPLRVADLKRLEGAYEDFTRQNGIPSELHAKV
jgi:CheY-like chemotaxis protein